MIKSRKSWQKCFLCKKKTRSLRMINNEVYCFLCWRKMNPLHIITTGKGPISLEEALNKTYEIRGYLSNHGHIVAMRTFPQILVGHKVKLVLADEEQTWKN